MNGIENGSRNDPDDDLRRRAISRLEKQRDFRGHVAIYLAVNAFLVLVWWNMGQGFFWPAFPIFAWGIGVVANAWEAYGRDGATEEQIQREIDRLRK